MAENPQNNSCSSDCNRCDQDCAQRDLHLPANAFSEVKHVIGVGSGKGGVGKSLVTTLLACAMRRQGYACGILDADITGPSVPRAFGISGNAQTDARGLLPRQTKTGLSIMSVNLLLEQEDTPVVWRGPVLSGVIQQFWKDVAWGHLDYLFVDMPPGTGDVALTVFQQLPLDGLILVTTPQDLVGMIVRKAQKMADMLEIPVLGFVENMASFVCPDCGASHRIFGESTLDDYAAQCGVPVLGRLPLDPATAHLVDQGKVEAADSRPLDGAVEALLTRFADA